MSLIKIALFIVSSTLILAAIEFQLWGEHLQNKITQNQTDINKSTLEMLSKLSGGKQ